MAIYFSTGTKNALNPQIFVFKVVPSYNISYDQIKKNTIMFCIVAQMIKIALFKWLRNSGVRRELLAGKLADCSSCFGLKVMFCEKCTSSYFPSYPYFTKGRTVPQLSIYERSFKCFLPPFNISFTISLIG